MKKASNFKIASIHVANVFIISWIARGIIKQLLEMVFEPTDMFKFLFESWSGAIFMTVLTFVGILLGMWYSKRYLEKRYIIEDKKKFLRVASITFAIVLVLWNAVPYFLLGVLGVETTLLEVIINVIILSTLFYWLSKKFIKFTEERVTSSFRNQ